MEDEKFDQDRRALLTALLDHVPFDGWTEKALVSAAAQAGLPHDFAYRAFPRGPIDAIVFFNQTADSDLLQSLENDDLEEMRIRDRITHAVRRRLELNAGHRDAIRRGATFLSFPTNVPVGLQALYRTVDMIWRAAGDTSTDFNFYTKRTLLAGVYSSTVLYWLNDNSDGFEKTWAFLDRRIEEVMQVPQITGRLKKSISRLPDPLAFRDILRRARAGTPFR